MAEDQKEMKKAFIVTSEFGREKGGIQNWMYYVYKLLELYKYDMHIYAYKEDNPFKKITWLIKSQVYLLATWKMSLFIMPILLKKKKTIFVFIHGNDILNLTRLQKSWLGYLCEVSQIYFIANSQAVAQIFYEITNREVDFVQYPFMEIVEKQPKLNSFQIPTFLTISRLVKRKNIHNVLFALQQLKNEGLVFKYRIAGKGIETENLRRLIQTLALGQEVQLLGSVTEEEKEELYVNSDYFLLPSVYDKDDGSIEGYGIVFIEANIHGLPVLSGNTGGMIEAVENDKTGLYCDGTINDIIQKIKRLITISFDDEFLYSHAQNHNYLKQQSFLDFIEKSIDE